jgi:hypothetical protein
VKQALTIGCGSGNGATIIDTLLDKGYTVTNVGAKTHPGAHNIQVPWSEIQITNLHQIVKVSGQIDFVFFNQNGSSLCANDFDFANTDMLKSLKLVKDWQHSHWISCQMPFLLLHTIKRHLVPETKIGWMLSAMMVSDNLGVDKYPDYSSQKYFNYLAMRCVGKHYQAFGIIPDFSDPESKHQLRGVIEQICDQDVNCKLFEVE